MPMIVTLGYGAYVIPTADAVKLMQILEKAEMYRKDYHDKANITHHVWPQEDTTFMATLMADDLYRMAKLAGKPDGV
jgi:hypothetical protein